MAALDELVIAGGQRRQEPATRPSHPPRGAMDWDDVRVFLAVARQGSMRAAGRALGLSQPTIARRLAGFEATSAAGSVEDAVLTLERRRAGRPSCSQVRRGEHIRATSRKRPGKGRFLESEIV
jgi:hypothetical protein